MLTLMLPKLFVVGTIEGSRQKHTKKEGHAMATKPANIQKKLVFLVIFGKRSATKSLRSSVLSIPFTSAYM